MEGKQSYTSGMDQDSSNNKRSSGSYFEANNFRVVTDEGRSSGALVTEKGNSLSFKVPDLAAMTLTDGTVIPAQSGLHIIGSCTMVDELILFTTASTDAIPDSYGQIWKCKYDEATDTISGLSATGELTLTHLFYNQKLNFSTEHRIGRAVALYETSGKQRVYWTDNYNPVSTFNLAVDNPLDIALNVIPLFPSAILPQAVMDFVGVGSLETDKQVQFTYRLLHTGGGETGYAPPTPLIPLPNRVVGSGSVPGWQGGGTTASKSVTYTITGLDLSYDVIEHIAIMYDVSGAATVWKFKENLIPASGNITVLCNSIEEATEIPLAEFSIISKGFDKCKDIEVQKNRLVAANVSTTLSEIEFDARAYRFNSPAGHYLPLSPAYPIGPLATNPMALLQSSTTSANDHLLIGGSLAPDFLNVPLEHDCQNIFNKEQEANWFDPEQRYQYKADGYTLGGEGLNVSYEFTTKTMYGNTSFDTLTQENNKIMVPSFGNLAPPLSKGETLVTGLPEDIQVNNQPFSMSGHWAHMNYTGYARGEVYRFGIVFYDKKGVPSFVEWIGDIKFPDVSDGFPLSQHTADGLSTVDQLGIEFKVDISSIKDKISGYSIVRLDREDKDKTKLGTGFFTFFNQTTPTAAMTLFHSYFTTGLGQGTVGSNTDPFKITSKFQYYGDEDAQSMHLPDRPGFNYLTQGDVYMRLGALISPFGNMYTSDFTTNDYIETLEYYNAELYNYYDHDGDTGTAGNDTDLGFYYKMKQHMYPSHDNERIQLKQSQDLECGGVLPASSSFLSNTLNYSGYTNNKVLANMSYTRNNELLVGSKQELVPLGVGSPRRILNMYVPSGLSGSDNTPPSLPHMKFDTTSDLPISWDNWQVPGAWANWYDLGLASSVDLHFDENTENGKRATRDVTFKSVGYRRYLLEQYGGSTYESRSVDAYSYIGHNQLVTVAADDNRTTEIYGGDTYVNYYDEEYLERYVSETQNAGDHFKAHSGVNKLSIAICGPVESAVNTNWRSGRQWAYDRSSDINHVGDYARNSSTVSPTWNQMDTVQSKFFSKDFLAQFVEEHPTQLWASKVKINGELVDSWRNFPIANKTEVDGIYGPINRILSFKDNLMYYQDRAFGIASLDERSIIKDESGQELALGTGGVFPDYKYVSTNTGTVHQFSVVDTESAVYHYDARLKKFMQFSNTINPLSDVKGLSSYFADKVIGSVTDTDKTLRDDAIGIHGVYDIRHNRVLYTYLVNAGVAPLESFMNDDGSWTFNVGDIVLQGTNVYEVLVSFTVPATNPPTSPNLGLSKNVRITSLSFTVGYSEATGSFVSFYDYIPGMYLEYGRRLFSVSPDDNSEMYEHNKGIPGNYYGKDSISRLHTTFMSPPDVTKIFNNISYVNEVYDEDGEDQYTETFDRMRFFNNYQDTGLVNIDDANTKRRMRTWRSHIPRDKDTTLSRMRNQWLDCILEYDNDKGFKHILHDIIYSYTPARM